MATDIFAVLFTLLEFCVIRALGSGANLLCIVPSTPDGWMRRRERPGRSLGLYPSPAAKHPADETPPGDGAVPRPDAPATLRRPSHARPEGTSCELDAVATLCRPAHAWRRARERPRRPLVRACPAVDTFFQGSSHSHMPKSNPQFTVWSRASELRGYMVLPWRCHHTGHMSSAWY